MLDKAYDPKPVEAKWLAAWKQAKLFHAAPAPGARPFTIVIPPPNVTGALHIGHALNNALQDVLIRYHRLCGRPACWVPGTDHGGIATQNVMEKQLKAEKTTRHALGRDAFLERMKVWTLECKNTILGQLARLGCALDADREAFTMDEQRARSVFEAFKTLWEKGLIYRGERMVNWCVRCGTALSDIEVEFEDRKGKLWHIRYAPGLVVATTRPETLLGDTAVAVNPKDERYKALIGTMVDLPLTGRKVPVVADEHVESSFGTGAVKVTPAHDPNDFEIGQRHKLPSLKVLGPDGKMTPAAGAAYAGLSREQAREKVLEDLTAAGLIEEVKDHPHSVGVCYRCAQVIEPLLSWQWFVKMRTLADAAAGKLKIYPESWEGPYQQWLVNIKDWCISRQIWWGHRIPVWYCGGCNDLKAGDFHQKAELKGVVGAEKPSAPCASCHGSEWFQDPDVLDTWFSSALWPFSVFGWPDKTEDLAYFYPTSVLITGYEILYLWVARMQMMGLALLGSAPFPDAVIHGIVRDKSGKKMSKSLGNVVDPLTMMDKYGTDAFRFSLLVQAHPGRDIPFAEDSITGSRNFANKLWNSTRFVLMNLPEAPAKPYRLEELSHCCLELADQWLLAEYQATLALARQKLEAYEPAAAADALYGFLWDKFCDWYVELAKIRLQGIDGPEKEAARAILVQVLSGTLKMLHPFMPYITEELHAALASYTGEKAAFILQSPFPETSYDWSNAAATDEMGRLMEAVTALRSLRAQLNVNPGLKLRVVASSLEGFSEKKIAYLKALARVESLEAGARPAKSATAVAGGASFYVPLEGVIDFAQERARLEKESAKGEAELVKIAQKVDNPNFRARAPQAEVDLAQAQKSAVAERIARLKETLALLS